MSKQETAVAGSELPEVPFWVTATVWGACGLVFAVLYAAGNDPAWGRLALVPAVVTGLLGLAVHRERGRRRDRAAARSEEAAERLERLEPAVPLPVPPPPGRRTRHPVVPELDGMFRELSSLSEVEIAAGCATGVPPSKICHFAVIVIDTDGVLTASASCNESDALDNLLHRAHQELIGGRKGERSGDGGEHL